MNTLVLAYAGASLPVLLLFSLADTSLAEAATFEPVAEAVVAMLVGSIGLITAVPLTTWLEPYWRRACAPSCSRPSTTSGAH
ncbi:MAG TPA: YibE/F family protein [Gaiellaceae bacterium]|nr:YibE/F family protein [Gaiellaceae bacterium]